MIPSKFQGTLVVKKKNTGTGGTCTKCAQVQYTVQVRVRGTENKHNSRGYIHT